ncbi:hypothetical protein H1235_06615 [Pseudoxanthomonas sp. NC8]|nr:hypothetical protein H1235_06615 [Pseudoxanthomonas sp. NC8]
MRVLQAAARHDQLERWLAQEIVSVKGKVESSGIPWRQARPAHTGNFRGMADLWDGCHGLEIDGEAVSPFLVFAVNNDEEDVLVRSYDDTGSFLHEHVADFAGQPRHKQA